MVEMMMSMMVVKRVMKGWFILREKEGCGCAECEKGCKEGEGCKRCI